MNQIKQIINCVEEARNRYIEAVSQLSDKQAQFKPSTDEWNTIDITEHLYWAEHGGIWKIWEAMLAKREGKNLWEGVPIHRGLSAEEIVARTWQPKEQVPASAAPRLGGPIKFWLASLQSLQIPLRHLGQALENEDLEAIIYPHPISGPMDAWQRVDFLRFHIDRHLNQVLELQKKF